MVPDASSTFKASHPEESFSQEEWMCAPGYNRAWQQNSGIIISPGIV